MCTFKLDSKSLTPNFKHGNVTLSSDSSHEYTLEQIYKMEMTSYSGLRHLTQLEEYHWNVKRARPKLEGSRTSVRIDST